MNSSNLRIKKLESEDRFYFRDYSLHYSKMHLRLVFYPPFSEKTIYYVLGFSDKSMLFARNGDVTWRR